MKVFNKNIHIAIISFFPLLVFLGCNEDRVDEPIVSFINPKIDSLVHDFTTYLPDSAFLYKGKKVVSVWIKQRNKSNYFIAMYNEVPAECEKRVGVLYKNGFKIYVLIMTDMKEQKLVHVENSYNKRSKKECQKKVDQYLSAVESDPSSRGRQIEEASFDFINDTLYFAGTFSAYDGFESNIPR